MRTWDLLTVSLSGLWRQKLRTALTLLGVLIGCAVLTVSLSVGQGVSEAVEEQFHKNDRLRRIDVMPDLSRKHDDEHDPPVEVPGQMNDARRARIREHLTERARNERSVESLRTLTPETIDTMAAWPEVENVVPAWYHMAQISFDETVQTTRIRVAPIDHPDIVDRLEMGSGFSDTSAREVLVSELLLYDMGLIDETAMRAAIGQSLPIRLDVGRSGPVGLLGLLNLDVEKLTSDEAAVLDRLFQNLPRALASIGLSDEERETFQGLLQKKREDLHGPPEEIEEEFRIVGVYRILTREESQGRDPFSLTLADVDVVLPRGSGEEFLMRVPALRKAGVSNVAVIVHHEADLQIVEERIKEMGYNAWSLAEFAEQVRTNVLLISFAMNFIALVALLVASIGITNTLFTSVIERTREIGVMKAVGAKDRHIQAMFLTEGALIGLIGGLSGLLIGWLLGLPAESWAKSLMEKQTNEPVPESLFAYPWWLLIGVPLFATIVTTLSALYPARRAARVHPVVALRHE